MNEQTELRQRQRLMQILSQRDAEPVVVEHLAGLTADEQQQLLKEVTLLQTDLQNMADLKVDDQVWMQHMPSASQSTSHADARARSGVEDDRQVEIRTTNEILTEAQQKNVVVTKITAQAKSTPALWMRFPWATAASVFLASALVMYAALNTSEVFTESQQNTFASLDGKPSVQGAQLAGLMVRSRDLELRLQGSSAWVTAAGANSNDEISTAASGAISGDVELGQAERVLMYRLADVDSQIARLYDEEVIDENQRLQLWSKRVTLLENLAALRGYAQSEYNENNSRSM